MKTISMDYSEYIKDLNNKEKIGFDDGVRLFIKLIQLKKQKRDDEILQIILDFELNNHDTKTLCELFGLKLETEAKNT